MVRVVTHERFRKWRRIIIFLIFVFAGIASPSPDPLTMLMLGGVVIVLVEAAEVFIWLNDKRYAGSTRRCTRACPTTRCHRWTSPTRSTPTARRASAPWPPGVTGK